MVHAAISAACWKKDRTTSYSTGVTLFRAAIAVVVLLFPSSVIATPRINSTTVAQCRGVTLNAAYLAQISPTDGPGFLLVITNSTDQPVKLARPFPTSAHWYAQAGGRWMWRASTGSGGALANAMADEHGPLLAYPPATTAAEPVEYVTVGAHQTLEFVESMKSNAVLQFRPGCERCRNPNDERYRAVLAYAYLPAPTSSEPGLLACGLRSGPVVMPPLK